MKSESKVAQALFVTPWTLACQAPPSIGIFQARVLEWVAISFSRGSSWPRDQIRVSCIVGRRFYCLSHQGSHILQKFTEVWVLCFDLLFSDHQYLWFSFECSSLSPRVYNYHDGSYLAWCSCAPVVMCGCESWTIKKTEHWKIDAFEPWYWRRLLRVPWTARRSNQSILKEISTEYSLEGLMLKLKLQYFGHVMRRTDSLDKTLMLGKIEGRRRRGWQRMRCLDGITDLMDMSLSKLWEMKDTRAGVAKSRTPLSDWTELNWAVLLKMNGPG